MDRLLDAVITAHSGRIGIKTLLVSVAELWDRGHSSLEIARRFGLTG